MLNDIIENSSELQYTIELRLDGLADHKTANQAYAERLAELKARRESWNNLTWKSHSTVPMQGLCHAYELVGGLFIKATGGHEFVFSWLPSSTHGGSQFERKDHKIQARDFVVDPGQDLIIYVEDDGG